MQFLEWSIAGLRSARRSFRHTELGHEVTLYPMVHLGAPDFYEAVHADAATHDAVVVEGVKSPVSRRLTRAYRWVRPARLGLVLQPKFDAPGCEIIHGDIAPEDFERLWRSGPLFERIAFEAGAGAFGLWGRVAATRASLGRHLNTTDLKSRNDIMDWSRRRAPLLDALHSARNAVLCETVGTLLSDGPARRRIAVIFGAGHMTSLSRSLAEAGCHPVESAWMTVFEA